MERCYFTYQTGELKKDSWNRFFDLVFKMLIKTLASPVWVPGFESHPLS